jgi:Rps23 Pro-64 3,4-dihydroxylase Tpa1-like proline 4-hydroxylase
VTGLPRGTLVAKVDCSSNVYAHGGHLLCHDDVISTRRASYILYLTDPSTPWLAADGGALELYPLAGGELGACLAATRTVAQRA